MFYFPAAILLCLVAAFGIGSFLSALNVKFRDFRYALPFLLQLLFFASQVIYPINVVSNQQLKYLLALNPVNGAIELFRVPLTNIQLLKVQRYLSLRDVIRQKTKTIFSRKEKSADLFWALQNINLKIEKGERIGTIGRNGAGKSTLLKILSKITPPTKGEIKLHGRVASLLEVGTGFHPELTGRENIYLNGSILGLTKKEIDQKLDEIIDFSGVEKFIDTPLKHYSSGMQLRLAFSVAAHLEPEILLIDEVLAVGDMEFQKKCIGKMEEISKHSDRTILFVSHNLAAINSFCQKTVWLEYGQIEDFGKAGSANLYGVEVICLLGM